MERQTRVLIAGKNREIMGLAEGAICDLTGLHVHKFSLGAAELDLSSYTAELARFEPDIVIYCLDRYSEPELEVLSGTPAPSRPPCLLMVHDEETAPYINYRLAMRSGANDILPLPEDAAGLSSLLVKLHRERRVREKGNARVTLMMSATGGGGASTLSAAIAGSFAQILKRNTLLLDLDIQFGSQYLAHDLQPEKGLKEALDHHSGLDPTALKSYITQHDSGLNVIGTLIDQLCLEEDISAQGLQSFIGLLAEEYEEVLIDLPCRIGSILGHTLNQASNIVIVVHQDLVSIRNSMKLISLLVTDFEQPIDRVSYILNKYSPDSIITAEDVEKALGIHCLGVVPLDSPMISGAREAGLPLLNKAPKAKATLAINQIAARLVGHSEPDPVNDSWILGVLQKLRRS